MARNVRQIRPVKKAASLSSSESLEVDSEKLRKSEIRRVDV